MPRRIVFFLLMASLPAPAHPARATPTPADYEPDPTSPDQVFEQMQHSFRSDRARGQHLRYQFNFTNPQGGKWWIQISDGSYTMGKGAIDHPDVTFNCSGSDWVQLSNGTLPGIQAFFTGRLKISGNQVTAHRLDEIFP
jgi:putative sterol carrier protein